ncbi:MAG: phospholipid-binding lipoprotein MlaA [Marinomonas primoryensis]
MLLHSKQAKHAAILVIICFVISACATYQPQQSSTSPDSPEQQAIKSERIPQLLTVISSHGVQEISPTVVGFDAPPSSQNNATSASKQQADFTDPFEFINRPMFTFNNVLYDCCLIPLSRGYNKIMPDQAKTSVSHFFANIREPINGINNLLQGESAALGSNVSRLVINSSLGILGLFDPAEAWFGIEDRVSHLDDTMRHYDIGYGSYIVLPFLGSSDLRNGFSSIVESIASPIHQLADNPQTFYLQAYEGFHGVVPKLLHYDDLRKDKEDPYAFFRNLYMQSVLRDHQFPVQEARRQKNLAKDEDEPDPQLHNANGQH